MKLRASIQGLELIEQLSRKKGWRHQSRIWVDTAHVSLATLKRFWSQIPIGKEHFIAICQAVGVPWEDVVSQDLAQSALPWVSWSVYDENWVGRDGLIQQLQDKLQASCRVLLLTGITGIGKTACAERLALALQNHYSGFYRIHFDARDNTTDFSVVAAEVLKGFGQVISVEDSREPLRLLNWLVSFLATHPYLVLFDSLDCLLRGNEATGWSDFTDSLWETFFHRILSSDTCRGRIVLTSQDLPAQLESIGSRYSNFWNYWKLSGLNELEQRQLFEKVGLDANISQPAGEYLQRIGHAYEGHPLALRVILGEIISSPFNGNIVAYWKQYGHEIEAVEQSCQHLEFESADDPLKLDRYTRSLRRIVRQRIDRTFVRLQQEVPYAYLALCLASVYSRPVPEDFWLNTMAKLGLDAAKQQSTLDALQDRFLIETETIAENLLYRQHNLIRSVALEHLNAINNAKPRHQ